MAAISNLKINEHSNVNRLNLRVTKVGNKNRENWFISKGKYENWKWRMRNQKIANERIAKMRNIEWTNNSKIDNVSSWILVFQTEKIQEIFSFSNLDNSKFRIWNLENLVNSEKFQLWKFLKFSI